MVQIMTTLSTFHRLPSNSSSLSNKTAILIGTGFIGIVVGLVLPSVVRCLTSSSSSSSSSSSNTAAAAAAATTAAAATKKKKQDNITTNGTNSVRTGLADSSVSIRIDQAKLTSFLSNLLVQAAATAAATTADIDAEAGGGTDNKNNNKKKAKQDSTRTSTTTCSTTRTTQRRKEKAELVASVLTYADARGIPSHGSNRCDTYVNEIVAGLVEADAEPILAQESGCCAVIDGKNGFGAVTAQLAMDTALRLATQYGVSMVTCHSSNHYGAAGYWAQLALQQHMIGMSFTNTSPFAIPTGGRTRAVGTNPFCFFAPATTPTSTTNTTTSTTTTNNTTTSNTTTDNNSNNHNHNHSDNNNNKDKETIHTTTTTALSNDDSFQLDMATTAVPIGKVEVMDRLGAPVPRGWGVDAEGQDCTDPAIICQKGGLYPLGGAAVTAGYKGYGLGMFVEILCSVVSCGKDGSNSNSNRNIGPDVQSWNLSRKGPLSYGHCFIVIDPQRFGNNNSNNEGFEQRLGAYLSRMRGLPGTVRVAGDPEKDFEREVAAHNDGLVLHTSVAITLKALAVRLGNVTVPTELQQLDENQARASLYE